MSNTQLVDFFGLLIALGLPAYVVLRFPWWFITIPVAAFIFWVAIWGTGVLLNDLIPERDNAILDVIWVWFGWIAGLVYAMVLFGLRCVLPDLWSYLIRRLGKEKGK